MSISLKKSFWMRPSMVLQLSALALLGSACTQEKPQPAELTMVNRQELSADSKYMSQKFAQWARVHSGTQMPIDFSDPSQYRFVLNRLRVAGNTPENSPYLFTQLNKARAKAMKAKESGLQTQTAALTGAEWCGHLIPFYEAPNGTTTRFTQNGLVTCFDGSEYSYVDVSAFETNPAHTEFTLLASNAAEDYYLKVLESPSMNADIAVGPQRELYVDSMSMAFDDTRGLSHSTYSTVETAVLSTKATLSIQHPKEISGSSTPLDNPIRTCLERGVVDGNNLDCDYASVNKSSTGVITPFMRPFTGIAAVDPAASAAAGNKWRAGPYWATSGTYNESRLYLPLQGSFTPGAMAGGECTVSEIDHSKSKADIILLETGGLCTSKAQGSTVASALLPWLTVTNPSNLQFNGLADFGTDCLAHKQNVRMLVTAFTRATCGVLTDFPRSASLNIQPMDFKNSCLAEGTRILRADGTSAEVEKIKVGDKVVANGRGLALTVTAFSEGIESKQMVRLRDGKGRDVLVTSKHPLIAGNGTVLAAEAFKVGDTVLARDGATRLTSVERVDYKGRVYNLTVGTEQELAKIGSQERTLYANGFLVGDNQMQTDLERQSRKPEDVLAQLSKAWHVDYRNDLSRRAKTTARK